MPDSGGAPPSLFVATAYVAAVSFVAALALFLIPPVGQMPLAHQVAFAGFALVLWSFSDGLFGRFSAALALLEGLLLLRLAIGWTRMLVEALGGPATGADPSAWREGW